MQIGRAEDTRAGREVTLRRSNSCPDNYFLLRFGRSSAASTGGVIIAVSSDIATISA